jgi:hypothetical protein
MLACRAKQLDANGKIAEATSMPWAALVCMGEVMAKGALYYSAVSQKDSAEFRAMITKRNP